MEKMTIEEQLEYLSNYIRNYDDTDEEINQHQEFCKVHNYEPASADEIEAGVHYLQNCKIWIDESMGCLYAKDEKQDVLMYAPLNVKGEVCISEITEVTV